MATTTASACREAFPSRSIRQPRPEGANPVTLVFISRVAPRRAASASSPSRTSRARFEAGKSFADSGSSTSLRPTSSSKKAICSRRGQDRSILRIRAEEESVTKRDSSTRAGRMLHRPPPLMRIFRPPSAVRSRRSVCAPCDAAKIAAIVPAAPAPITATRFI